MTLVGWPEFLLRHDADSEHAANITPGVTLTHTARPGGPGPCRRMGRLDASEEGQRRSGGCDLPMQLNDAKGQRATQATGNDQADA